MQEIKLQLKQYYGIDVLNIEKASIGAGSDTYFVQTSKSKYVAKFPSDSNINYPKQEPALCNYMLNKGLPVCEFIANAQGEYLTPIDDRLLQVQRFLEGTTYDLHSAPNWLMNEMAAMLGRIHAALKEYPPLPEGIGKGFFQYMTPDNALRSYHNSLAIAQHNGDTSIENDLHYRIDLLSQFPYSHIDINLFSCGNTHGDYFISQIIAGEHKINAVTDWTSACVHPYVWELLRSFVYAAPSCREGSINISEFLDYLDTYLQYFPLTDIDIINMPVLYYYQIAVCDYYGQYYSATSDNRSIYLDQAILSTKLMHWFENHMDDFQNTLKEHYKISISK